MSHRLHQVRRRMTAALLPTLLIGALAGGCAQQERYDQNITANRSLREQIAALEADRNAAQQELLRLESQLASSESSFQQLQSQYGEVQSSLTSMRAENEQSMSEIAQLELGPLPYEVENAIKDLAGRHPDFLSFNSDIGLLRFASDFTFDLGSTELSSGAQASLTELASVLNTASGQELEVRIIGHTDNVPIRRAATLAKHPTNRHLSVHRAISVADALNSAGVEPVRMQVAGYGEHRPIVANGAGGAPQNRRVEIFLASAPEVAVMEQAPTFDTSVPSTPSAVSAEPAYEPMK